MDDKKVEIVEEEQIAPEFELNLLQIQWLMAHGGRTPSHVYKDGKEFFVYMGTLGGGEERVFIPSDHDIKKYFGR